jgi:hypothetical protein
MLLILTLLASREITTGLVAGFLFGAFAIIMGMQTFQSYRAGFMYNASQKVYRERNPVKFKVLFVLHLIAVFLITSACVYAFLA